MRSPPHKGRSERTRLTGFKQVDALQGLRSLTAGSVQCIVTSPPYNKGSAHNDGRGTYQAYHRSVPYVGFEDKKPEEEYQAEQVALLEECARVLAPGGSVFYNHKDRHKNFVLTSPHDWLSKVQGLQLRQVILWDRQAVHNFNTHFFFPVTEYIYWLTKKGAGAEVQFDRGAVPPAFRSTVWRMRPARDPLHPVPFPEELVEACVGATTKPGDLVVDPYCGSRTVLRVAERMGRRALGFDIVDYHSKQEVAGAEEREPRASTTRRRPRTDRGAA